MRCDDRCQIEVLLKRGDSQRAIARLMERPASTIRLKLVKIAARVVEMKTMIRLFLPSSCPYQPIICLALQRLPRLTI